MRKLQIIIITLLIAAKAFSQAAGGTFKIRGHISKMETGTIFLSYSSTGKLVIDSSKVVNGNFEFSGNIAYPLMGYFRLDNKNLLDANSLFIFLEPAVITAGLNSKPFSIVKIEGSKSHDEMLSYTRPYIALKHEIDKTLSQAEAEKDPNKQKALEDSVVLFNIQKDSVVYDFAIHHLKSYVTPHALYTTYQKYSLAQLKKVYNNLDSGVTNSNYGKFLLENINKMKANTVGDLAANIVSADYVDGKTFDLKAQKGKYVVIDFWGSWCQPCLKLMPSVVAEYNKYKNKDIVFVSVCLDYNANKNKCKEIANKLGMAWVNLWDSEDKTDENSITATYNVGAYPTFIVIGPDGDILERGDGDYGYLRYKARLEKAFRQ